MDPGDQFRPLISSLADETAKIGLHMKGATIVQRLSDECLDEVMREAMENAPDILEGETEHLVIENPLGENVDILDEAKKGRVIFAITATFQTADLAWDDRTLHPERFAINTKAAALLPSKAEMLSEEIHRQMCAGVMPEDVVIPEEYR